MPTREVTVWWLSNPVVSSGHGSQKFMQIVRWLALGNRSSVNVGAAACEMISHNKQ